MANVEMTAFFEDKQLCLGENILPFSETIMPKLACKHYGFDCNFITTDDEVEKIIKEFRKHTIQEHYIDYPEGVLMKFITNKK